VRYPRLAAKIAVASQDFARRFMSSADDAANSGIREFIRTVQYERLGRDSGLTTREMQGIYDTSLAERANLIEEANRRGYDGSLANMWAFDEENSGIKNALIERVLQKAQEKGVTDLPGVKEGAESRIDEISKFAAKEAELDTGTGPDRDKGSRLDLQWLGEWAVSNIEKVLHVKEGERDPDAYAKYMLARMMVGFVRIPFNFASRTVFRGPFGLWRLLITMGKTKEGKARYKELYARSMGTELQRVQRWKEAIISTVGTSVFLGLLKSLAGSGDDPEDDVIIVNGSGPKDKQAADAWRKIHQANTVEFKVGNRVVSIPFGRTGLEAMKPSLMLLGGS